MSSGPSDIERTPPHGPIDDDLYAYFSEVPTFLRLPINRSGLDADICILGIPYDGGVTERAGAREGPRGVRLGSTMSRQQHAQLGDPYSRLRIVDAGDVPVDPFDEDKTRNCMKQRYRRLRSSGARVIAVGGDHSATLSCLEALAPEQPLALVHFDAHSDTCDIEAGSRYNHATVFRRAVELGLIDPKRSIQIGLRSDLHDQEDLRWAREAGFHIVTVEDVFCAPLHTISETIHEVVGDALAYLSVDIDVLDPAFAPGTGDPEPGGLSTRELRFLLSRLDGLRFAGADLMEVAPPYDVGNLTSITAGKLLFDLVCVLARSPDKYDGAARERK